MSHGSVDELTPEDYRARYVELMRRAQERASLFGAPLPYEGSSEIRADAVVVRETIAAGWYWSAFVPRGYTLRIENTSGTPGVGAFFWNADDTSERYCVGDTVKIQWTVRIQTGRLLLSDMGRVLFSVTSDTNGLHETLLGGTTRRTHAQPGMRNTRDNLLLAAGKHGLGKRDLAPLITFFAGVETDGVGGFAWRPQSATGAFVDLRAEMNVLVALSNTPHPLAPMQHAAGTIDAVVWRSPPARHDDRNRNATIEAIRAFQNTDGLRRV